MAPRLTSATFMMLFLSVVLHKTMDLEWVQLRPTGLVKLDDHDAKIKFLAAESFHGVGGLIFDAHRNRFSNELGRWNYGTGEMWKSKLAFRLALANF